MTKRPKLTWSQMFFLLLPVCLLAGFGFWLQKQGPTKQEPFRLIVSEVEITRLPKSPFTPPSPNARGVKAVVWIDHRGEAPAWWGTGVNPSNTRVVFLAPKQVDDGGNNGNSSGTIYDVRSDRYAVTFKGEIPATPLFLENSICKISLGLETQMQLPKQLASLQVSIPTRTLMK